MLIPDPGPQEVVITQHTCDYHKWHPEDRSWPGCTCSGSYALVSKKIPDIREPTDERG